MVYPTRALAVAHLAQQWQMAVVRRSVEATAKRKRRRHGGRGHRIWVAPHLDAVGRRITEGATSVVTAVGWTVARRV